MTEPITIAIADDHVVLRNGLAELIKKLGYTVLFESSNGKEFMETLPKSPLPDVVLMDINMPQMDGFATTLWLKNNYPAVRVLALSMYDDEAAIIRMLKYGAKGYLLKESEASDLKWAIDSVYTKGFYYSDLVTGTMLHSIHNEEDDTSKAVNLNEKEIAFLKLAATEMTYKEIADQLHLSPRTVDGYREALFEKLDVKSRVGLVLWAIKNRIVQVQ